MADRASGEHRGADFRPDIEGLRGLAVLLVVLYHCGLPIDGGFIGVDVFFVISGYLITGLLLRERERTGSISFVRFYARRIRRLLPAAAVVLLACLAGTYLWIAPLDQPSAALDGAAAALSVANIRFALTTDYFNSGSAASPFLHFWSLGVEEQFYLVWPALLLLATRIGRPRMGAGLALVAVAAGTLAASCVVTAASPTWAYYSLPTRAWQLSVGGLVAVGEGTILRLPRRPLALASWAGVALIVLAAVRLDAAVAYPGIAAIWPTAGAAALIAAGGRSGGATRLFENAALRFLGRVSYSLYLWHWPILVFGALLAGGALAVPGRLLLAGVAIIVATVSWVAIEEPFRRGFSGLAAHPRRALALGMSMVLALVLAGGGVAEAGTTRLRTIATPRAAIASSDSSSVVPTSSRPSSPEAATSATPGDPDAPGARSTSPHGVPQAATAGGTSATVVAPPTPARAEPTSAPSSEARHVSFATPAGAPSAAPATHGPTPAPSTAAANARALPADVSPPVAEARADEERLRADGCLGFESATAPPGCVYGDRKGSFVVALVGDSHAAALFPAVETLAVQRHWRLLTYTKVACPFLDLRVRDIYLQREYTECAAWNRSVLTSLARIRPDLVLVSMSRWIYPVLEADGKTANQAAALARMLEQVASSVAVIGDVPASDKDVPACLSAHPDDITRCATSRSVALGSDFLVRERAAASSAAATLIDLTAAICASDPCPAIVRGMIVYRDGHHLTATFARSLAPALAAELVPLLERQSRP